MLKKKMPTSNQLHDFKLFFCDHHKLYILARRGTAVCLFLKLVTNHS